MSAGTAPVRFGGAGNGVGFGVGSGFGFGAAFDFGTGDENKRRNFLYYKKI